MNEFILFKTQNLRGEEMEFSPGNLLTPTCSSALKSQQEVKY